MLDQSLEGLLGAGLDDMRRIVLKMQRTDGTAVLLPFMPKGVPIVIAALVAELGRLAENFPPDRTSTLQPIRITGSQIGMRADGSLALLFILQTGAVLPIQLGREDLVTLGKQIEEAQRLSDPALRH